METCTAAIHHIPACPARQSGEWTASIVWLAVAGSSDEIAPTRVQLLSVSQKLPQSTVTQVSYLPLIGHCERVPMSHMDGGDGFARKWGSRTRRISRPSDFRSGFFPRSTHLESWRACFASPHRIPHASFTRFGRTLKSGSYTFQNEDGITVDMEGTLVFFCTNFKKKLLQFF